MKNAFTLAEVLITLAIIGVVSVLTMPSLTSHHARKVLEASEAAALNEISMSASMAMLESNAVTLWESEDFTNRAIFQKYFKASKYCGSSATDCFDAPEYFDADNNVINISNYIPENPECAVSRKGYAACYSADVGLIDLNGDKGPNRIGTDVLGLVFDSGGAASVTEPQSSTSAMTIDYSACGKIKAIKAYRNVCGGGLKEAKEAVESGSLDCGSKDLNDALKSELISIGCTVN